MMSKRIGGVLHILIGLTWVMVALAADPLGLGAAPHVIGWKQWLAAGAGAVVILIGMVLLVVGTGENKPGKGGF